MPQDSLRNQFYRPHQVKNKKRQNYDDSDDRGSHYSSSGDGSYIKQDHRRAGDSSERTGKGLGRRHLADEVDHEDIYVQDIGRGEAEDPFNQRRMVKGISRSHRQEPEEEEQIDHEEVQIDVIEISSEDDAIQGQQSRRDRNQKHQEPQHQITNLEFTMKSLPVQVVSPVKNKVAVDEASKQQPKPLFSPREQRQGRRQRNKKYI